MTESIAEAAGKVALSPKPTAIGPAKSPDKPEPAGKSSSEASNPAPEPPTPPPSGGGRLSVARLGGKKQTAIVASAVFSLIAGIAGVGLLWPPTDGANTTQTPTQQIANDTKQTQPSTANPSGTPDATKPTTVSSSATGITVPPLPTNALPSPTNSLPPPSVMPATVSITPSVVPPLAPPSGFSANNLQSHYMITDQVISTLKNNYVPETVLVKFTFFKNREFSQDDMEKEISRVLTQDEKGRYLAYIVSCAKVPETIIPPPTTTASPTPSLTLPSPLPVPVPNANSGSSGVSQVSSQPHMPALPPAPPSVSPTPTFTASTNGGAGYPARSPNEIAAQTANPYVPLLPSVTPPPPTVELQPPQPVMPAAPGRQPH
ncbi:MAG TPA: hypothetical protein VG097_07355, partial [Gemmata sp.]|nr:hypothetical protein [Gemmata sp.]